MIQFYFLSIFCNAVAGYMLIHKKEPGTQKNDITYVVDHDTLRLILGIMSITTGLFKLLSAVQGDVPVIGDLIPALVGFTSGSALVFEYYRARSNLPQTSMDSPVPTTMERLFVMHKKQIGFLALGTAVLHFLFPQALLI